MNSSALLLSGTKWRWSYGFLMVWKKGPFAISDWKLLSVINKSHFEVSFKTCKWDRDMLRADIHGIYVTRRRRMVCLKDQAWHVDNRRVNLSYTDSTESIVWKIAWYWVHVIVVFASDAVHWEGTGWDSFVFFPGLLLCKNVPFGLRGNEWDCTEPEWLQVSCQHSWEMNSYLKSRD